MPRVAFEELDHPHIDIDQTTLPGTERLVPAEMQWVGLDDAAILDGSLAVAGWTYRGMQGEVFGGPEGYEVVPHFDVHPEVEVDILGLTAPKYSTQEDIIRNLIKLALSSYDTAQ
jgi:hypothetical protein